MSALALTRAQIAGASGRWLVWLPAVWLAAPLLALVALPPIDPDPAQQSRPLEQLSTLAIVLSVSHMCWVLGDAASWVSAASPRGAHRDRAVRALGLTAIGGLAVVASSPAMPDGVGVTHTLGVWKTMFGLGLAGTALWGRVAASVLPALLVGVSTLGGSALWPWNALFNPDARVSAGVLAVVSLGCGAALFVSRGEAAARREALGGGAGADH